MRVSRVLLASIGLRIAFSTLLETYKKKNKKKKRIIYETLTEIRVIDSRSIAVGNIYCYTK